MKKLTRERLIALLSTMLPEYQNEYDELVTERDRNAEKANANAQLYSNAHGVIIKTLIECPKALTVEELFTYCEDNLPEGFTRSKLQYALNNTWANEVTPVNDGRSPRTYRMRR